MVPAACWQWRNAGTRVVYWCMMIASRMRHLPERAMRASQIIEMVAPHDFAGWKDNGPVVLVTRSGTGAGGALVKPNGDSLRRGY